MKLNARAVVKAGAVGCLVAGLAVGAKGWYDYQDFAGKHAQSLSQNKLESELQRKKAIPLNTGQPFAFIWIPRFGSGWRFTVSEGATDVILASGPGHWPGTALPGQVGNFAVLSHTVGGGDAFMHIKDLRIGDSILIQTQAETYTYKVTRAPYVISATDMGILSPVPGEPNVAPTRADITLISCLWPDLGDSSHRQVVIGELSEASSN